MDIQTLLISLMARGIFLRVEGGHIVVTPASRLTDKDAERIRALKPALLDELDGRTVRRRPRQQCVDCGAALPRSSWARCPACVETAYQDCSARWAADTTSGRRPPHGDQRHAA